MGVFNYLLKDTTLGSRFLLAFDFFLFLAGNSTATYQCYTSIFLDMSPNLIEFFFFGVI